MSALKISAKLKIEKVTIGAVQADGGTRSHSVVIGGQGAMPFLFNDGDIPNPPLVAVEVWDVPPEDLSPFLLSFLGEVAKDPISWANYLIEMGGFPLIFLRLMGAHPDYGGKSIGEMRHTMRRILDNIQVPLIVSGCGIADIDDELIPAIAEEAQGEKLLLAKALVDKYRRITASCIEHGHSLITESPIDINIAKQVNILVQDAGLPADRIVMYATTGALGYGLEYAYSIMEKARLLGLQGDIYMNKPQIALVGQESWRVKEANRSEKAGILWETVTAAAYLHAGADIVVVQHPISGIKIQEYVNAFFQTK